MYMDCIIARKLGQAEAVYCILQSEHPLDEAIHGGRKPSKPISAKHEED